MKKIITIIFLIIITQLFSQNFDIEKTNEFAISQSYYSQDCIIEDDNVIYTLSSYGLEIFNILANGSIELLSRLAITASQRIAKKDDYIYISATYTEYDNFIGKLYQINIYDIENPYVEQEIDFTDYFFDLQIYGEFLYINSDSVNFFYSLPDLSLVAQYNDYLNQMEKLDDTKALRFDGYNQFTVFYLSDPTQPEIIGYGDVSSQHQYNIHRARTHNDTILICSDNDLITFWNVSDWNNWDYISQYQLPHTLFNCYRPVIKESKMILVEFGYVELIDISDILLPMQLNIISGTAEYCISASCVNNDDNIYIATNWNGIQRLKLINNNFLFEEEIAENYENARCIKYGDYLIKSTMLHGYKYFDISNPIVPIDMGQLLPEYSYHFRMANNLIAVLDSETYDCDIYDLSDINNPVLRNSIDLDIYNLQEFDSTDENSIYFNDLINNKLKKYDISEPGTGELLFEEQLPFNICCGIIHNGYGYLIENSTNNYQNLYIYKYLDINQPVLCNTINNIASNSAVDINIVGDYLSIYSQVEILIEPGNNTQFFDISDPESPELIFNTTGFGKPYIKNDLVFTSSGHSCYVYELESDQRSLLEPIYIFHDINNIHNISFVEHNNEDYLLLSQWSNIGVFNYEYTPSAVEDEIPSRIFTLANNPNPFNPETTIIFNLPEKGNVKLEIFNIKGQKVKQLISNSTSQLSAGRHSVVWDGRDENGKLVSSGIYFYKLKTGKQELSRKMLMLK